MNQPIINHTETLELCNKLKTLATETKNPAVLDALSQSRSTIYVYLERCQKLEVELREQK